MSEATKKQYAALLAEWDALVHTENWDRGKERELSRKMMALVRSRGPGSKELTQDEYEAAAMQSDLYERRIA